MPERRRPSPGGWLFAVTLIVVMPTVAVVFFAVAAWGWHVLVGLMAGVWFMIGMQAAQNQLREGDA